MGETSSRNLANLNRKYIPQINSTVLPDLNPSGKKLPLPNPIVADQLLSAFTETEPGTMDEEGEGFLGDRL
jgi:hypothetical protein